jgi:hypothetical protein
MTSDHIATISLDNSVTFCTIVAFIISLVALLTSSPVMRHEDLLWNQCTAKSTPLQSFHGTRKFITTFKKLVSSSCRESVVSRPHTHILFFKIHFNIIFPSTPIPPKWFLPLRVSHRNLVSVFHLLRASYTFCPSLLITVTILSEG